MTPTLTRVKGRHMQMAAAMQLRGALWRPPMIPVAMSSYGYGPSLWVRQIGRRWCSPRSSELARLDDRLAPSVSSAQGDLNIPDHRYLATEQKLFITHPTSPGSPLFLPNGARIFHKLQEFLRAQYAYYGFEEVVTPTIYKKVLWETSGHWDKYSKDMFVVTGKGTSGTSEEVEMEIGQEEEYGLKPMNCPGHCLLFKSSTKSYRDLPVRYADFSPLHRNEISGSLSGLTRVRRFHQDDAHIFCQPSQIASEISSTLEFIETAYRVFQLPGYRLVLSTRPDSYIGTISAWDRAETALEQALDASGKEYSINTGDGAFYGPKIDIILKDSHGKEHQTATIQLDFQLPARFNLLYQTSELEKKGTETRDPAGGDFLVLANPVIIHRAIFGSLERFMALLIEHYNGRWPFWLSPRQAVVIPVINADHILSYARAIQRILSGVDDPSLKGEIGVAAQKLGRRKFTVDIDTSGNSIKKKIRQAKEMKYHFVAVVGERNIASQTVTINSSSQLPMSEDQREMSAIEAYEMFVDIENQYL